MPRPLLIPEVSLRQRSPRDAFPQVEKLPRSPEIRLRFKFPVVGDLVYGRRHNARLRQATGCAAPRQMLHARALALTHPRTGQRLVFEAPLPADFTAVLQHLRLPLSTNRPSRPA